MKRLLCMIFGHRWGRIETTFPRDIGRAVGGRHQPDYEPAAVMRWVRDDFDYYVTCARCGRREGRGERYD